MPTQSTHGKGHTFTVFQPRKHTAKSLPFPCFNLKTHGIEIADCGIALPCTKQEHGIVQNFAVCHTWIHGKVQALLALHKPLSHFLEPCITKKHTAKAFAVYISETHGKELFVVGILAVHFAVC